MPFEVIFEEIGSSFDFDLNFAENFNFDFGEVLVSHEIPSNYGLITWDGLTLTVS